MLLVVTAHMGTVALGSAYNATNPVFYIMATQSGYTGVAIFFFLSGYGLMESERKKHLSLPLFVRKRFGKIYIPTLLVTAIWLIVSIIAPLNYCNHKSLIFELLWDFADPVMWFVRVMLPLYLAFGLTTIFIRKYDENIALWGLFAVCIVFAVASIVLNNSVRDHSVPLFAIGAIASSIKTDKNAIPKFSIIVLSIGALASIPVLFTAHPLTGFAHSYFDYIVILLLVLFICTKKPTWKLPTILTAITFDIYLTHFKFFTIISQYLPLSAFLILTIPGSMICAYLFYKLRTRLLNHISSQ